MADSYNLRTVMQIKLRLYYLLDNETNTFVEPPKWSEAISGKIS